MAGQHLCADHYYDSIPRLCGARGESTETDGVGEVVTQLMKDQFKKIVDVDFTAQMEKNLDEVEEGAADWVDTLSTFYEDFAATLSQAEKNMDGTRVKVPDEETDEICELCGRKMVIKTGRFGKFLACPGFPECKNTRKIVQEYRRCLSALRRQSAGEKIEKGKSLLWMRE